MSLGKVPMKAGGGAKQNASIEQGMQVSTVPTPGTVTLRNSVEILTNLYTYHGQPRGREGEGQTAALMHKYELEIARPQSEYASSNAKRRPVCWIGVHDPRTPLTSIGSILT